LTNAGDVDWALWDDKSGTAQSEPFAPTNSKNVGSHIISGVSSTPAGTVRGPSSSDPTLAISYSDGVSPTSQTSATTGVVFDSTLDSNGSGISFTITGDPTRVLTASILVTGFAATGTLTAQLPGATPYTDSSGVYAGSRSVLVYTLNFQPAAAGQNLSVSYTSSVNASNGNVDLQAVAVSAVPEPTAIGLCGLACVGLLARRRRTAG
jgi:hypothetical protein